jgi:hypothetical protein
MNENTELEGLECITCLGEHQEEIHSATLNVRAWFHHQVVKHFEDEEAEDCEIYYLAEAV